MGAGSNGASEPSEANGGTCPVEPSVWQRLHAAASHHSGRIAIASLHQPSALYNIDVSSAGKDHLRWTYAELQTAVDRLAISLEGLGAKRGKAIATFLFNGVEFILAFWAAHKLGCPFVPINPRTLVKAEEAAYMLQIAEVSIVIVQDDQTAALFDALPKVKDPMMAKVIISDSPRDPSWVTLASRIVENDTNASDSNITANRPQNETVTVLFTSGTTSLPKGVPHTDTTLNAFCENLSLGGRSETSIFCSVLPNNHAMGYFYTLHFMMHGAAIVYPSPSFDANAMVTALEIEKSTHTALVPTTLHALLETLKARGNPLQSSLLDVCLAGSSITPDNMRQAIYELHSRGVSTGFGMTEGSPIWTAPQQDPEDLINGNLTIAGRPSPGAHIRICGPGSRIPVPKGERGELHQTGPGLVTAYLGTGIDSDQFYSGEDGRIWFVTGDEGVMLPDGRVSITGRYKDMIIRGGENIAPAAIETVLNKYCGIQTQVVGAPDSIAGEVPIVVLHDIKDTSVESLQEAVRQHMGPAFVPDEVITLKELELADFPKTTSGKIQKSQLAALVRTFRSQRDSHSDTTASKISIQDTVVRAYYKATGIPIKNLDVQAPITNFADSISYMRVRDSLRKDLGFTLTLEEMVRYPNIDSQIKLLQKRNSRQQSHAAPTSAKSSGPPSLDEMSITFEGREQAEKMRDLITKTVEAKGFNWFNDVVSVIPAYDYMQVLLESELINSWNFAIAIMADGSSTQAGQLRRALEAALSNNPLFVSMYVVHQRNNPHYVTLKPSAKLWELCILDFGSVKTAAEVQQLAIRYPYGEHATAPGPLFRCLIIYVEETKSAAMVMYVHHIVQDASSTRLFYEDLDLALSPSPPPLRPHVDFKAWADCYLALRRSPAATVLVDYHVHRLRELHLHKKALYPPAPLPRQACTENPDGLDHAFDAPGLLDLKKSHPEIIAAVVLKAAMALVNVARTGHTHALFCNFEAGRTQFPFIPASVASIHPTAYEASDVAGPVMQGVCNLVAVPREETALSLLQRMQAEQHQLSQHAHAPLRRIIDALNADGNGAGDMIVEAHRSHFLTWIPGFLGEYERLRVAQIAIRSVVGLVVVAGIGGERATLYMLSMRWDEGNYGREETRGFVEDLEGAVGWLTDRGNWGRGVGEFVGVVERRGGGDEGGE